jgi:hypothetical protein
MGIAVQGGEDRPRGVVLHDLEELASRNTEPNIPNDMNIEVTLAAEKARRRKKRREPWASASGLPTT